MSFKTKFLTAFLVITAIGCGREPRQVGDPPFIDPAIQAIEIPETEPPVTVAEPEPQPAEARPPTIKEEDCTVEYAMAHDKQSQESVAENREWADEANKQRKAAMEAALTAVATFQKAPPEFGESPAVLPEQPSLTVLITAHLHFPHWCRAIPRIESVKDNDQGVKDWRLIGVMLVDNWNQAAESERKNAPTREVGAEPAPETSQLDYHAVSMFTHGSLFQLGNVKENDTPAARRVMVDGIITVLAKGGPAMQWAAGFTARISPENRAWTKQRFQNLYSATKHDFAAIQRELIAAQKKALLAESEQDPNPELSFTVHDGPGQYFKGLVLRYWFYKEQEEKGSGNRAVARLQKVLRGVAKGMDIKLN